MNRLINRRDKKAKVAMLNRGAGWGALEETCSFDHWELNKNEEEKAWRLWCVISSFKFSWMNSRTFSTPHTTRTHHIQTKIKKRKCFSPLLFFRFSIYRTCSSSLEKSFNIHECFILRDFIDYVGSRHEKDDREIPTDNNQKMPNYCTSFRCISL